MSHRESALMPWIASHTDSFSAAGASTLTLTGFGLSLSTDVDLGTLGTETGRTYTATDGNGNGSLVISLNVAALPESPATVQVAVSNGGVPAQQSPLSVQHGVFDPTTISSLVAWYDADDGDTLTRDSSDLVGQWDDKSGNGFDLIQGTTTKKPKYFASGGGIGEKHVRLGYNGSRHHMRIASDATWATHDGSRLKMSTFVVFHWPGVGGADWSDVIRYSSSNVITVHKDYGAAFWYGNGWQAWWGGAASTLPTKVLGGWFYTDSGSTVRVNGSVKATDTTIPPGSSDKSDKFYLGISSGGAWPNLEISEILIFNTELTGDDLSDVESYLNNKWSIY